ncbi:unnamed protein product [Protopolystoma xenopodis]|uniref:Uncharacterized protein n=1 Tax=Protopolystoma xenopodis TaxID=117903 RepID=A0A3S5CIU9_9PLAT|nr:unnamed protein product [Protopolystoma xenopodis]
MMIMCVLAGIPHGQACHQSPLVDYVKNLAKAMEELSSASFKTSSTYSVVPKDPQSMQISPYPRRPGVSTYLTLSTPSPKLAKT